MHSVYKKNGKYSFVTFSVSMFCAHNMLTIRQKCNAVLFGHLHSGIEGYNVNHEGSFTIGAI